MELECIDLGVSLAMELQAPSRLEVAGIIRKFRSCGSNGNAYWFLQVLKVEGKYPVKG